MTSLVPLQFASTPVERAVLELRRLTRTATLEYSMAVGKLVVDRFYGGDLEHWRSRGPKISSFRKLAQHPALPMSPASLYQCVAAYEIMQGMDGHQRWEHIGISHVRAVIGLAGPERASLLGTAERERWSAKHLAREAAKVRVSPRVKGGRPPDLPWRRAARAIRRSFASALPALQSVDMRGLPAALLQELSETSAAIERAFSAVDNLLAPGEQAHHDGTPLLPTVMPGGG